MKVSLGPDGPKSKSIRGYVPRQHVSVLVCRTLLVV